MLIAALAAREPDLTEAEGARARDQIASCAACTDLLADLVVLQVALPTASTPSRPRDFSLSPADAARLRAGGWRRALGFFGSARDSFSRPLAVGLTTLGLAGLLVGTLPSVIGGGGAASVLSTVGNAVPAAGESIPLEAAPAAGGAAGTDRLSVSPEPGSSTVDEGGVFAGSNQEELDASGERDIASDTSNFARGGELSGQAALFTVGGLLLIAGMCLFALRWSARRLS
jgi:hypothetical protein